jgi:hypothetical protein
VWSVFKLAARSAVWRTTPDPPLVGLPSLIGWTLVLAAVRVALQYLSVADEPLHFNPYGLNAVAARLALEVAVAAFFVQPQARTTALAAMFVLSIFADLAAVPIQIGTALLAAKVHLDVPWSREIPGSASFAIQIIWWLGAMSALLTTVCLSAQRHYG